MKNWRCNLEIINGSIIESNNAASGRDGFMLFEEFDQMLEGDYPAVVGKILHLHCKHLFFDAEPDCDISDPMVPENDRSVV